MNPKSNVGFVGGGNMAGALVKGLLTSGVAANTIHVADPDELKHDELSAMDSGIRLYHDANEMVGHCDMLVLAVKPQIMQPVVKQLREKLPASTLVISVAAGVLLSQLEDWLHPEQAIVRSMPNTPALVGYGATGLFANAYVTEEQFDQASRLFESVGVSLKVESEDLLDAVIAVSGSGPAYVFKLMESMQSGGEALGLDAQSSAMLTLQTVLGAAQLVQATGEAPGMLRDKVTSPGGTTQAALELMQREDLSGIIERAMRAAVVRAKELANEH